MKSFVTVAVLLALVSLTGAFAQDNPPNLHPGGKDRLRNQSLHSLTNAKRIALGCLMLAQDSKGVLKATPATLKQAVMPYVKTDAIFTSSLDRPGAMSYKLNPKIAGVHLDAVKDPSRTVMLYEGDWKKPIFRYEGKAIIAYADGRAVFVSPQEIKSALWDVTVSGLPKPRPIPR